MLLQQGQHQIFGSRSKRPNDGGFYGLAQQKPMRHSRTSVQSVMNMHMTSDGMTTREIALHLDIVSRTDSVRGDEILGAQSIKHGIY